MEENRWKKAFEQIKISPEDREEIWGRLKQKRLVHSRGKSFLRAAAALAVIVCAGIGATLVVDGMTGSRLASALSGIWKVEKSSEQIVEKVTDQYYIKLDNVYAPELIECSDPRIIFANAFGLVIYDRQQQRVTGTIDLEKIQCNYFNADTLQTKFLLDEDRLTVYNLSEKKVSGKYYVFDLNDGKDKGYDSAALEPVETGNASDQLEKEWKTQSKARALTWEDYPGQEDLREMMYSEHSLQWETRDHIKYRSFLVIEESEVKGAPTENRHSLMMYHRRLDTNEIQKEKLCIQVDENSVTDPVQKLPAYQYRGKDPIEKALADCFANDPSRYEGEYPGRRKIHAETDSKGTDLAVPLIDIVGVKKDKKYTKVYGTFRWESYSLSGNTLYSAGGSGGIGVAYLKETEDGYKVKKILHPRDGGLYMKDLLQFSEGDEALVGRIRDYDLSRISVRVLKKYVKQNQLNIRYYKEFGWDPHKLQ